MTKTKIKSKVQLLSRVLYSGSFWVPWHQRHYVWGTLEVRDLLYDLKEAFDADKTCYFLGSIMLLEPAGKMPERINDGQQRLITFSLLMAALCRCFAEHPGDTGRETLALRTLFDRPGHKTSYLADATRYEARIKPPKGDEKKYAQLICGHDIGSNGRLIEAWNRINRFVGAMSAQTRAAFFDFLMRKVEISVLTIPSDVDANFVFETLNARGKSLEHVDLIRNWVLSCFSEGDDATRLTIVRTNFENPGAILGEKGNKVETYFRCALQCRYGSLRKERLYREFREGFQKAAGSGDPSGYAYSLVRGLGRSDSIELYRTIISAKPNPDLERHLPRITGKRGLAVLLGELRGYTVSHPLCFALLHRFMTAGNGPKQKAVGRVVVRSLKNLASFIMRGVFVTSQFRPSRIEVALADCARTVFTGTDIDSLDIMGDLEENDAFGVVSDPDFIRRMTGVEMRSNPKALRYLYGINAHQQKGSDALTISGCSVEHVLPQSLEYWSGWTGFRRTDPAAWVYRTGNLVVISQRENQGGADFNANFAAKQPAFSKSALLMAQTVAKDYPEWSPKVIEKRSKQLAQAAAKIWTFRRGN